METAYVACRVCGARWDMEGRNYWSIQQPRQCQNPECDAGWLDLPMFKDKAYADQAAAERVPVTWEP